MAEVEDVVVNVPCTEHYPQFKTLDDVVGFDTEYYHLDFKSLKTINSKLFLDKYSTGTPAFVSMGTYGQVYRSESSEGVFAVKKFVMINGYNEPHRFYQNNCMEVVILKSVNHPNVVRLLDASVVDGYLHAAFDYYENDISRFNFGHLQRHHRNWRLLAMKHISNALAYLHSQLIIHRDVKPSNILYRVFPTKSGKKYIHFALCDFGAAIDCKGIDRPVVVHTKVTTCTFEAPEMMLRSRMYTSAVDVFGLGCVLYYIMTNGLPLLPHTLEQLPPQDGFAILESRLQQRASEEERAFFSTLPEGNFTRIDLLYGLCFRHIPPLKKIGTCNDLLLKMIALDPNKRPTAKQVNREIIAINQTQRELYASRKQGECKVL